MNTNNTVDSSVSARILACLDQTSTALIVARQAGRLARQLHAPWEAVYVATPLGQRAAQPAQESLLEAFRLAEELGAETRTLNGDNPAAEILIHARAQNASHIVVGASSRPAWIEVFTGSIASHLLRGAEDMVVQIVPRAKKKPAALAAEMLRPPPLGEPSAYLAAGAFVALATLLALPVDRAIGLPNISLVYVLAVIAAAARYGAAVAAFTAVSSALAYNFFLTEPYYTFEIADPKNIWAVFFFLLVGVAVSAVAAHARAQTVIARRQAKESADLQAFAHGLVGLEEESAIAASAAETCSKLLYARVVILAHRHGELEAIAELPGPEMLGADDLAAAQWAFDHRQEAGHGSGTLDGARWLFIPVPGERGFLGVIGVRPFDDASRLDPEQRRLLDLIAAQAGVALDRARFARGAGDARIEAESERLKAKFLSSVSHDLRTPLTTIRGAIESALRFEDKHDADTRRSLLQDAAREAEKLSTFIQNMLDMDGLDAGAVRAKPEPVEVASVVDAAVDRAHSELEGRFVSRDLKSDLPRVMIDRALTESALANILGNAAKYGPTFGPILVRAYRQDGAVAIEVLDEGPGFPEYVLPHPFEKFGRGVEGDGRPPGPGLGLAAAKGFITAQGGTIEVGNRTDRSGARVLITLPIDNASSQSRGSA